MYVVVLIDDAAPLLQYSLLPLTHMTHSQKDFKYLRLLPAGSSISAHEAIQREYEQSEFVAHTAAPPLVIQSNVKLPVLFRREFPLSHFAHGIGCVDFEVCTASSTAATNTNYHC